MDFVIVKPNVTQDELDKQKLEARLRQDLGGLPDEELGAERGALIRWASDRAQDIWAPAIRHERGVRQPPGGYNPYAVRLTALASAWSYADAQDLANGMYLAGLKDNVCIGVRVRNPAMFIDTNAFLVADPEARVGILAFRGTEIGSANMVDLLTDIDAEMIEHPMVAGRVHGGFYRSLESLWAKLVPAFFMLDRKFSLEHLFITGHSLGGALAVLATADLFAAEEGPGVGRERIQDVRHRVQGVYTFGQPMVGDEDFARNCEELFGSRMVRCVNGRDWVPHLPPYTVGRFRHFGNEYASDDRRGWKYRKGAVRPALTAIGSGLVALAGFLTPRLLATRGLTLPFSLDDHMPRHYLQRSELATDACAEEGEEERAA